MRFLYCLLGGLVFFPAVPDTGLEGGNVVVATAAASLWGDGAESNAPGRSEATGQPPQLIDPAAGFEQVFSGGAWESQQDDFTWEPVVYGSGFTAEVMTSAVWDDGSGPELYVGGMFQTAGKNQAFGIVRWDGEEWSALGFGVNGTVRAMIEFEGSLIVAGDFTQAFGYDGIPVEVNNIARWDGNAWSAVGNGFSGPSSVNARVLALAVYDGELVAGGNWLPDAHHSTAWIARWNGFVWLPLGEGVNGEVWDLIVLEDDLVAAGTFTHAGGQSVGRVARWDGQQWSPLGTGMDNAVIRLAVYNDELIAGGPFSRADGQLMNHIARWTGTGWERLGTGVVGTQSTNVRKLTVYNGELIAAGTFTHASGQLVNHIARWNGTSWAALGGPSGSGMSGIVGRSDGLNGAVSTVSVFNDELIAGGMFYLAGGARANYIARWDGNEWAAWPEPNSGLVNYSDINNGVVRAVVEYDGRLIAGGGFHDAAALPNTNRIAAWDGAQWSALGGGVNNITNSDDVNALAVFDGDLIAGGSFTMVDNVTGTGRIARWDGSTWSSMDGGFGGGYPGLLALVNTLLADGDDLFAGGTFLQASGQNVNGIARWDGTQWHPLGGGLNSIVHALAMFDGDLIVAGGFTLAGSVPANFIARWDGTQWHPFGSGANAAVTALTVVNGELIAAGGFTQMDGVAANHIARWDGDQWLPLAGGLLATGSIGVRVSAMTELYGDLYVAGLFARAINDDDQVIVNHIARWDGSRWWPLSGPAGIGVAGGPNNPWLFALGTFDADGAGPIPRKLVAGGFHMMSGGAASWGLGFYGPAPFTVTPAVLDFGAAQVGQTVGPQSVTISNQGGATLTVTTVDLPGGVFPGAGGSCDPAPFTLPPGTQCALDFLFEPATAGEVDGQVVIGADTAYGARVVGLRGVAGAGDVVLGTPDVEFDPVAPGDTSEPVAVMLTNAAQVPVEIVAVDAPLAPFVAAGGSCGTTPFQLAPQATCSLAFAFQPAAAGAASDTLFITHDGSGGSTSITLSGVAAQRTLEAAPLLLDFGSVAVGDASTAQMVQISNPGTVAANLTGISTTDDVFEIIASSCGALPRALAPGESCVVSYHFKPLDTGTHEGAITIDSDSHSTVGAVAVQGLGTGATLLASHAALSVVTGPDQVVTRTLDLANDGNDVLSWQVSEARAADLNSPEIVIAHSTSMEVVQFNSIACSIGLPGGILYTAANSFMRSFALDDFWLVDGLEVTSVTFGIEQVDSAVPLIVNLYRLDGSMHYDNLVRVGSATMVVSPQALSLVSVPVSGSLPPRTTLVVEIEVPDLFGLGHFFPGSNPHGESAPTYWASAACQVPQPVSFDNAGYPGVHGVMEVTGQRQVDCSLPDWLEVAPQSGLVAVDDSTALDILFDSAGLPPGDYQANLCLQGNNPLQPVTVIPVSLVVDVDVLFQDRFE